jgi:nitrate reductase NapAB chaperone NapD
MPRTVEDPHNPPTGADGAEGGENAHVSGIVVHAVEAEADRVAGWIDTLAGAEVAGREGGRLVVVLEAADEHALADLVNRISLYDHVYSAALVSHYVDDPVLDADGQTEEGPQTDGGTQAGGRG